MDRKQKIIAGLDLPRLTGVEIGALNHPTVTPEDGDILYVDHADTPTLRAKYANDPNVDIDQIVMVSGIWGANSLSEAIGGRKVDYVLASHVVEHVPDLIGWLNEIAAVLVEGGQLRLAVPDRRYIFDVLRQETELAQVLNAYLLRARAPLPAQIVDHITHICMIDHAAAWEGAVEVDALRRLYSDEDAHAVAKDAVVNGAYHDVHCWVFTPKSFAELMRRTAALGLHDFACSGFHDTARYEDEFHVAMIRTADRAIAVASWQGVADRAGDHPDPLRPARSAPAVLEAAMDRIALLQAERDAAAAKVTDIENSTSWRATAPLRQIARLLRPPQRRQA